MQPEELSNRTEMICHGYLQNATIDRRRPQALPMHGAGAVSHHGMGHEHSMLHVLWRSFTSI